jgi:hypothetical protein
MPEWCGSYHLLQHFREFAKTKAVKSRRIGAFNAPGNEELMLPLADFAVESVLEHAAGLFSASSAHSSW